MRADRNLSRLQAIAEKIELVSNTKDMPAWKRYSRKYRFFAEAIRAGAVLAHSVRSDRLEKREACRRGGITGKQYRREQKRLRRLERVQNPKGAL